MTVGGAPPSVHAVVEEPLGHGAVHRHAARHHAFLDRHLGVVERRIGAEIAAFGRDAQEHVEALKVAETQLERLKYIASTVDPDAVTPLNDVFSVAEPDFCLDDNFQKVLPPFPPTGCEPGTSLYKGTVRYDGDSTFTVTVTWDRAVTNTKGNVQLAYKLHDGTN